MFLSRAEEDKKRLTSGFAVGVSKTFVRRMSRLKGGVGSVWL